MSALLLTIIIVCSITAGAAIALAVVDALQTRPRNRRSR